MSQFSGAEIATALGVAFLAVGLIMKYSECPSCNYSMRYLPGYGKWMCDRCGRCGKRRG